MPAGSAVHLWEILLPVWGLALILGAVIWRRTGPSRSDKPGDIWVTLSCGHRFRQDAITFSPLGLAPCDTCHAYRHVTSQETGWL
jgi:hypothetical protein